MSAPELDGPAEDDALGQMVALLRLTVETLRYMADFGVPAARASTLSAVGGIERAIVELREAALAARPAATPATVRRDQPPCH